MNQPTDERTRPEPDRATPVRRSRRVTRGDLMRADALVVRTLEEMSRPKDGRRA